MEFAHKNMLGIFNEMLSRQNSRQTSDAMDETAQQGFFCGSTPPFGFKTFQTDIPARSGFKKN